MEIMILDENKNSIGIIDNYNSLLWVDCYDEVGHFELLTNISAHNLSLLRKNNYIWIAESEHLQIIERVQINTDSTNSKILTASGRSAESILARRVVWNTTVLKGNVQECIEKLLNENAISPSDEDRKIPSIIYKQTSDERILNTTIDAQYSYSNLLDTIKYLCWVCDVGFKMTLSLTNELVFELYKGYDRSYEQLTNPFVVFSAEYDNLISSNYVEDNSNLKNVALVAGQGEDEARIKTVVGSGTGLSRREIFTDARDLSTYVDGVDISAEEYISQLAQRGEEDLQEHLDNSSFDAQVDSRQMFVYGSDFFMGDVIQIDSEYDITGRARITEIIITHNESGRDLYPTFTMI